VLSRQDPLFVLEWGGLHTAVLVLYDGSLWVSVWGEPRVWHGGGTSVVATCQTTAVLSQCAVADCNIVNCTRSSADTVAGTRPTGKETALYFQLHSALR